MNIRFTNTLSGKLETFKPLKAKRAGLYVCGLTPYDSAHLGHGRCYVFFDIVRRTLEASGYKVLHVQNFTDVDDRILSRSKEQGISPILFAGRFMDEYFDVAKSLNILPAHHYPRVTRYIPQIIAAVQKLIASGHAYAAENGDVYYQTSRFAGYGKLSKKPLEALQAGARVEVSPHKREPTDFALWKADTQSELSWQAPWSKGRPGWHIECSVMSAEHLGQPFDIHGGGEDLIFPHHENEIAQSEALAGVPFARYFIHNGFVTINQEKMSKSLGNFFALKDLLARYEGNVIRYYLLTETYRRPIDFSDQSLEEAGKALARIKEAGETALFVIHAASSKNGKSKTAIGAKAGPLSRKVLECLAEDFHTPSALAALQDWSSKIFEGFKAKSLTPAQARQTTADAAWALEKLLGIAWALSLPEMPTPAEDLIAQREIKRREKNFAEADSLRKELAQKFNLTVEDTPYGPRAKTVKRETGNGK